MILPERVVVRFAAVFAAPRTLDKVKYLLIEPVAFVPVRRFVTLPPKRLGFVVASTSTKRMLRAISLRYVIEMNFSYALKREFIAPMV